MFRLFFEVFRFLKRIGNSLKNKGFLSSHRVSDWVRAAHYREFDDGVNTCLPFYFYWLLQTAAVAFFRAYRTNTVYCTAELTLPDPDCFSVSVSASITEVCYGRESRCYLFGWHGF